ncbi:hypothetical protein A9Q99_17885 [Gammaproteobacteria bacterium 45_16_T64]|nr:hypothetical protein A9Q99_17885 [Gammaproteobacteria bacterium 45_16_T64]
MSLALETINDVASNYRRNSRVTLKPQDLAHWRPYMSLVRMAQTSLMSLSNVRERHVIVDSHKLSFWDIGSRDKEPLVLLHGFGANKENWAFLFPWLQTKYRILIPDVPGFGRSYFYSDADYSLPKQADRLNEWLDQIGVRHYHLVGNSMGGGIAALMAATHKHNDVSRVKSLTLMNAAGVAGENSSPFENKLLDGENVLIPNSLREVKQLFDSTTHEMSFSFKTMLTFFMTNEMRHRYLVNHHLFNQLIDSAGEVLLSLKDVDVPTLIMWGAHDKVLDPSCSQVFAAEIPHAKTAILDDVGHLPMLERPRRCASMLHRFFTQQ